MVNLMSKEIVYITGNFSESKIQTTGIGFCAENVGSYANYLANKLRENGITARISEHKETYMKSDANNFSGKIARDKMLAEASKDMLNIDRLIILLSPQLRDGSFLEWMNIIYWQIFYALKNDIPITLVAIPDLVTGYSGYYERNQDGVRDKLKRGITFQIIDNNINRIDYITWDMLLADER